jgi:hypothetical protein
MQRPYLNYGSLYTLNRKERRGVVAVVLRPRNYMDRMSAWISAAYIKSIRNFPQSLRTHVGTIFKD